MEVRLFQFGDHGAREVRVDTSEFFIGRENSCNLKLDYAKVSLRHCRILKRAGRVMVEDLNSTNGTAVNDRDLGPDPFEVQDGDRLRVGPVHFRVAIRALSEDIDARLDGLLASAPHLPTHAPASGSDSGIQVASKLAQSAKQILDRISHQTGHDDGHAHHAHDGHHHHHSGPRQSVIEVAPIGGASVVRVLPRDLTERREVRHLVEDLGALIDGGKRRIVVDLILVEKLSSQVAGFLLQAHRRCQVDGGALRLCAVNPATADVFAQTDLIGNVEIYPDERTALADPWDQAGSAPAPKAPIPPKPPAIDGVPHLRPVRLIVEVGRAKGQGIEIRVPKFVIGRDPRCNLRPNTETVSRLHAVIEQRDGIVYVRDLGTKNGTVVGDRTLRGQEVRAVHGDHLGVGVLQFTMAIGDRPSRVISKEEDDALAALLGENGPGNPDASTLLFMPTAKAPAEAPPPPEPAAPVPIEVHDPKLDAASLREIHHLTYATSGDVMVATITTPRLDEEETVAPLRLDLQNLLEHARPNHLVLSLKRVEYLSQRAGGLLLAISQRIERAGGTLRICDARPAILPTMQSMRLPDLADVYPTLEDAMAEPWS